MDFTLIKNIFNINVNINKAIKAMFYKTYRVLIKKTKSKIELIKGNLVAHLIEIDINKDKDRLDQFFKNKSFAKIMVIIDDGQRSEDEIHFDNHQTEKLAKLKLKEDSDDNTYRGYYQIDENNYCFINIKENKNVKLWIEYLVQQNIRFSNIYALKDSNYKNEHLFSKQNLIKLYNPKMSPIIISDLINFIMSVTIFGGIILAGIVFLTFFECIKCIENQIEVLRIND